MEVNTVTKLNSKNKKQTKLVLYPLYLSYYSSLDANNLKNCLSKENALSKNIFEKDYKNNGKKILYSIVADKFENNFMYGRFIKLNSNYMEKIKEDIQSNKVTITEELVKLETGAYFAQNAHFVCNLNSGIMLANYNSDSVNILTSAAPDTFNHALQQCNLPTIKLTPFPSSELINEMIKKKAQIFNYYISFPQLSVQYIENIGKDNSDIFKMVFGLLDTTPGFKLKFKLTPSHPEILTPNKLKSLRQFIRKSEKMDRFTVYTDYMNFDLVADKYVYYSTEIDQKEDIDENREVIYKNIYSILIQNHQSILNMVSKDLITEDSQRKF